MFIINQLKLLCSRIKTEAQFLSVAKVFQDAVFIQIITLKPVEFLKTVQTSLAQASHSFSGNKPSAYLRCLSEITNRNFTRRSKNNNSSFIKKSFPLLSARSLRNRIKPGYSAVYNREVKINACFYKLSADYARRQFILELLLYLCNDF